MSTPLQDEPLAMAIPRLVRHYRTQVEQALMANCPEEISEYKNRTLEQLGSFYGNVEERPAMYLRAMREIDDLPRRILFGWLHTQHVGATEELPSQDQIIALCNALLGSHEDWLVQWRLGQNEDRARLVAVLTWQCETRCTYCSIPKQDGREMPQQTLEKSIDLLLSSDKPAVEFRFFGGEPMMAWDMIQHGISYAMSQCSDRDVRFYITSNGYALTEERLTWLSHYPVHLQLALDGLPEAHNTHRASRIEGESSYAHSAIDKASILTDLSISHDIIWVVHPARVQHMLPDFRHIAEHGFRRIQINWAHNLMWKQKHLELFAAGLHDLGGWLHQQWSTQDGPWLCNLGETLEKVRNNREITVDWDGTIYANNGFLYRPKAADGLRLGHLDDGRNWLHYRVDGLDGQELLEKTFAKPVRENNAKVGSIFNSWIRWMRSEGLPEMQYWRRT